MTKVFTYQLPELPNKNGRVYPRESFDKACFDYMKKIENKTSLGELGHPSGLDVSLQNCSHLIEDIRLRYNRLPRKKKKLMKKQGKWEIWKDMNRCVKLDVKILKTPKGIVAKSIIDKIGIDSLDIGLRGMGNVQKDGTIENVKIMSWDLINKKA